MLTNAEHDLRRDQRMVLEAVTTMVSPGVDPVARAPVHLGEGSTVTILRGFDRPSRGARDALRSVLERDGVAVHDVAPVPALGAIPAEWRTDLVVAVSEAVTTAALRCAARWGAPALLVEAPSGTGAPIRPTVRTQPVVTVATPGCGTDVVTRALRINGPVTCSLPTGKPRFSDGVLVEPSTAALCATFDLDTDHPHTRVVRGPLTLDLRHATIGYVDDVPHLFGRGKSHAWTDGQPLARIFPQSHGNGNHS